MSSPPSHEVTRLLHELESGNSAAGERLYPLVYDELRRLAASFMRAERKNHTLQPTALVHEAYLRMVDGPASPWQGRAHFFGVAARAMRCVLVDHARRRGAAKRASGQRVTLDEEMAVAEERTLDLAAIDDALQRLAALDERQAKIVELRFFGGLEIAQTAEVLGISPATVKRDWLLAKAWLYRELGGKDA